MPTPASLPSLAPLAGALTLLELAVGCALVAWLLDSLSKVGRGYRGTTAVTCAVLLGLGWLITVNLGGLPFASHGAIATLVHWEVAFGIALLVDVFFAMVGTDAARLVVGAIASGIGVATLVSAAVVLTPGTYDSADSLLTLLPAALLGGSALAGMLLGHWYLISPDLSFRPLRISTYVIFAAVILEGVAAVIGLTSAAPGARQDLLSGGDAVPFWTFVVTGGVFFTAAVNGLTLHFARIRANQPATAMLYVVVITTLLGVVPATLLFLQRGVGL